MPSSSKSIEVMLKELPTNIQGKIIDLGSGWGSLAFPIAKQCDSIEVLGFECSLVPFIFSRIRLWITPLPNLHFYRTNFYNEPLTEASLVVCYLYPDAMRRLKEKFTKELKPGTWIISNTFAVPGWKPKKIVQIEDIYQTKVYVYVIGDE